MTGMNTFYFEQPNTIYSNITFENLIENTNATLTDTQPAA
jgi:hypothetical protein